MADEIDAQIGRRLLRRRRIMGMTQQKVGEAIGVRFQQVQKYECGSNRVSAARLWSLAQALDVPISYFFDGMSAASSIGGLDAKTESNETFDLIRTFSKMEEEPRRHLLDLARGLAGRQTSRAPV